MFRLLRNSDGVADAAGEIDWDTCRNMLANREVCMALRALELNSHGGSESGCPRWTQDFRTREYPELLHHPTRIRPREWGKDKRRININFMVLFHI